MLNIRDIPRYEAIGESAAKYPNMDPAATEAFIVLLHTGHRLANLAESHLQREGISHARFVVLAVLNRVPGQALPGGELAQKIGVTKQTLTSLVDGLEQSGYVCRMDHSGDRRVCLIGMTRKGKAFMERVLPGVYDAQKRVMSALTPDEQRDLARVLRVLWGSMSPPSNEE
jgi:DNA-binding MarR family transcriptional regulator